MTLQLPFTDVEEAENVPVEHFGPGTPEYAGYWSGFRAGAANQSRPPAEPDERVTQYIHDGWRIGRLFRLPLPCMRERS